MHLAHQTWLADRGEVKLRLKADGKADGAASGGAGWFRRPPVFLVLPEVVRAQSSPTTSATKYIPRFSNLTFTGSREEREQSFLCTTGCSLSTHLSSSPELALAAVPR
jgi:hypothetical protein